MSGGRSRAVRAVRGEGGLPLENFEHCLVSKISSLRECSLVEEKEVVKRGRPYKVCGGKSKDRKGIVAKSFKELVEKGKNNNSFCRKFTNSLSFLSSKIEVC